MSALWAVCLSQNQIGSLAGVENKPALKILLASYNQIKDISALETSLGQLRYLDLGSNVIEDIRVLSGLSGASREEALLLENNQISDISALSGSISCQRVTLYGNPIKDFSVFASVKEVNTLYDLVYFSYAEGWQAEHFANYNSSKLHIVDAPANQ